MKKILLSTLIILTLIFAACSSENENIIGNWSFHPDELDWHLEFSSSGSGVEFFEGEEFQFNWNINDTLLEIDIIGHSQGSFVAEILTSIASHDDSPSFGFFITEGNNFLILQDNHGHGHFQLTFLRN